MNPFERADTGRRVTWWSILGLLLVPVLVAGGFIFATWKAGDRLDTVQAAIVNNDEGTEIDGQTVPLGRQLAAGLVDRDADNLDWVLSTDEDAADGLADGSYAAVVTIPEDFSKTVISFSEDDPMKAHSSTLDVQTSRVSPVADATIGQAVAAVATGTFNTEMTKTYLDNIYLGFNEMHDQMRTLADAAGELEDGTGQLSEGAGEAAKGSGQLSDGLGELSAAGGELNSGARDISSGAGALSKGAGDLASGASDLSQGAGELADGLGQMDEQTKNLPKQTRALADGSGDLSKGVDEYTRNIDNVIKALSGTAAPEGGGDTGTLDAEGEKVTQALDEIAKGADGLSTGIKDYQKGLRDKAAEADRLAGPNTDLDTLVNAGFLSSGQATEIRGNLCTGAEDEACPRVENAYAVGFLTGMAGGLEGAADGLSERDPATGQSLLSGAQGLADSLEKVSDGVSQLLDGVKDAFADITAGFADLQKNTDTLLDASAQLRDGASQVADGTDKLADGMPQLSKGVTAAADGADKLADGADAFADGAQKFSGGASELADGAGKYAQGVGAYTDGVDQTATGARALTDGLQQLDKGAGELADGTSQFADGVDRGAEEVPSYTAPERKNLADVVTSPVSNDLGSFNSLMQGSTMALLIMMAMWIGGLATYTVVRAVSARALTSRSSSWAVMARGLVPGVAISLVQAVVLALLAGGVLELGFVATLDLLSLTLFAGLVFTVLNFALVAWFGGVGRFVSIALVVLAVAGRIVGAVPEFFHTVAPFLPLTPAMNGVTAITADVPGLGVAWAGLVGWLILGLGAAVAAVARKRTAGFGELMQLARA